MGRTLQIGSDASCGVGGWNAVPSGCSAQSGGDWTPHFQTASKTCGGADSYQLVCTEPRHVESNYGATLWPQNTASPCCLTMLPYTVLSRAAAPWCCFTMMPHCDIAYTPYCLHTKSHRPMVSPQKHKCDHHRLHPQRVQCSTICSMPSLSLSLSVPSDLVTLCICRRRVSTRYSD